MRITVALDDDLLGEALRLTGMTERTALIHEGLRARIQRENARGLTRLGATEPSLRVAVVPARPKREWQVILVDTSVWVDHLRSENATLPGELGAGRVLAHPFVIGELAGGTLRNRREALDLLGRLPSVPTATHAETLDVLERRAPMGRGIDRAQRGQRLAGASSVDVSSNVDVRGRWQ